MSHNPTQSWVAGVRTWISLGPLFCWQHGCCVILSFLLSLVYRDPLSSVLVFNSLSLLHSFIQQTVIVPLLGFKSCTEHWGHSRRPRRHNACAVDDLGIYLVDLLHWASAPRPQLWEYWLLKAHSSFLLLKTVHWQTSHQAWELHMCTSSGTVEGGN
jgi:hypothetical protein